MLTQFLLEANLHGAFRSLTVFVLALAGLLGIRFLIFRRLRAWAAHMPSQLDGRLLKTLATPSIFWCVALAAKVSLDAAPLDIAFQDAIRHSVGVLLMLSTTLIVANVAGIVVTQALRRQSPDGTVPGLGQAVIRTVVFVLGAIIVLNALGVEIAPLLTALGVGGLAVALALQDTLTNFFAGIHILLERPFEIGQFIRLDDGQEGHVLDIGWRTTRIRTQKDDVVVVPNSKMAGSTILNYHMPITRSRLTVSVSVAYDSDVDRVKAVLVDEALQAVAQLDYLLAEPMPEALLIRLGEYALDYQLRFHVRDVVVQGPALDEMNRRVVKRLRAEGIEIPFPVRTVRIV